MQVSEVVIFGRLSLLIGEYRKEDSLKKAQFTQSKLHEHYVHRHGRAM